MIFKKEMLLGNNFYYCDFRSTVKLMTMLCSLQKKH